MLQCGDGTQRLCGENKVRLGKLKDILITQVHSDRIGGLAGMLLTLSDSGNNQLRIAGPVGIARYIQSLRFVYKRPDSAIKAVEICNPSKPMDIEGFSIESISIPHDLSDDSQPFKKLRVDMSDTYKVPIKFGKFTVERDSPDCCSYNEVVCFFFRAPAKRGKFHPSKALELGVAKGPDFGKLTRGITVEVDGRQVTPSMCMETTEIAQLIGFIDCPDLIYLDNLIATNRFDVYYQDQGLRYIFHLAPEHVVENSRYLSFIKRFKSELVSHVFVNSSVCENRILYLSSARIQKILHFDANDKIFPLDASGVASQHELCAMIPDTSVVGDVGIKYIVHPLSKRGFQPRVPDEKEAEIQYALQYVPSAPQIIPPGQFELSLLGTGSAIPSKYRNVTSNLLRTNEGAVFLDCGESSCFQLFRRFGKKNGMSMIQKDIKLVWISHMHADHHLGILQLLSIRRSLHVESPLRIIGPPLLKEMLDCMIACNESINSPFVFTPIQEDDPRSPCTIADAGLQNVGIRSITCVPVLHCYHAYGAVIRLSDTVQIVFSGDTEPCDLLASMGKDATLLIHEATFEDAKVSEARSKRHSTISEGIQAGVKMNAQYTVLTHFSQRYPKQVIVDSNILSSNVILASDLMTLNSEDLPKACMLMPTVMKVFDAIVGGEPEDEL